MPEQTRIIGGMFGLEIGSEDSSPPPFLPEGALCFANARSALYVLTKSIRPGTVWMASYFCPDMLAPFQALGVPVRFYDVGEDLRTSEDWYERLEENDLVIVIDYFGWTNTTVSTASIHGRGALLLEDACPSLLSPTNPDADFVLYSPRKFLGVPDGGILLSRKRMDTGACGRPPAEWITKAFRAYTLRREFDVSGVDRSWFSLFQDIEKNAPVGAFFMTDFTEASLRTNFHYEKIAEIRRANYQTLHERLAALSLMGPLQTGTVPIGYPIVVSERNALAAALYERSMYPPVHWRLSDVVPASFIGSRRLSESELTLPCDQRYSRFDMEALADAVLRHRVTTPQPNPV